MCAVSWINVRRAPSTRRMCAARRRPDKYVPRAVDRTPVRRTLGFTAGLAGVRLRRRVCCGLGRSASSPQCSLRLRRGSQHPRRSASSPPVTSPFPVGRFRRLEDAPRRVVSRLRSLPASNFASASRFPPSFLAGVQFCLGAPFPAAVSGAAPADPSLERINILCAGGVSPTRCSI